MFTVATFVVLGATGDLTGRLLLPALARLSAGGDLGGGFAFLGAGPEDLTPEEFRNHARTMLTAHAHDVAAADREWFLDRIDYRSVDVTDTAALGALLEPLRGTAGVVLYLALPTDLVTIAIAALESLPLPPSLAIAVEKPLGDDLRSATHLNAMLRRLELTGSAVFRVDHVLGLPAVAALPGLQAAVPPIPAGAQIHQITILWEETLALEGRAAFYDRAGALKDLLQNHLLQILCMVTIDESTITPATQSVANGRFQAMQAVRIPSSAEAATHSRRARYSTGRLAASGGADGATVPDYVAEPGVNMARRTETFAEVALRVSTPRWAGTRFVLRAGKAMARRRRGILVHHTSGEEGAPRQSWIDVDEPPAAAAAEQPGPGGPHPRSGAPLEQIAYTRVLESLLSGVFDISISADESERAWEIFEPVLTAWAAQDVPMTEYAAGSTPPPATV